MPESAPLKTVLIVDDDDGMRDTLVSVLRDAYRCFTAESAEQALAVLHTTQIDLLLADVRLPGMDGITLVRRAKADIPDLEVLALSVLSDVEIAVQAIKAGAFHYLVKSFDYDTLHALLATASNMQNLRRLTASLQGQIDALPPATVVGGAAPAMRRVLTLVDRIAALETPLLLEGDTGTGKTLLARHLHSRSTRAAGPFIEVRTTAVPADALEATLRGFEPGAVPGATGRQRGKVELASGGTLFLDEVADLPESLQAYLVRVLEDGHTERLGSRIPTAANVRLIVATRTSLRDEVQRGRFREDLYYRLSGIPIQLPPLRERLEDLPALVQHFLSALGHKTAITGFSGEAIEALQLHDWPGNVRELKSLVERLAALHDDPVVTMRHLPTDLQAPHLRERAHGSAAAFSFAASVTRFEQRLITRALERAAGNLAIASRELAIPLSTLKYKVRRFGLRESADRSDTSAAP